MLCMGELQILHMMTMMMNMMMSVFREMYCSKVVGSVNDGTAVIKTCLL